jgi:hypothetical protein
VVELVPEQLRQLCDLHADGVRTALLQPALFHVSWGRPLSERVDALLRERDAAVSVLNELKEPDWDTVDWDVEDPWDSEWGRAQLIQQ